jgi:hypothetical protein
LKTFRMAWATVPFLWVAVMGFAFAEQSESAVDFTSVPPTVPQAVASASVIARVKLVGRVAVHSQNDPAATCGFKYSGRVVELLKGHIESDALFWFSNFDTDYAGMSGDYLVFVSRLHNTRSTPSDLLDPRGESDGSDCAAERGNSYVPRSYLAMYPFDEEAHNKIGGDWLFLPTPPARDEIAWCWDGKYDSLPLRDDRVEVGNGRQKHFVEKWKSAKRQILYAVANPNSALSSTICSSKDKR